MKTDYDVIVIGAGINGAGIARDAAMRGLKVLLVDKNDIGGGASAASTRLIHGGLRYLEHFEFGLVRESLRERETLLRIAPHLVRPLQITIPIYKESRRGRATIRAGMIAYDLLSAGKSLPRHRMQARTETLAKMPGLNPAGLRGSAVYYDAQVEFAERLVLENVLAAVQDGATVMTHTRVTELLSDGITHAVRWEGPAAGEASAPVLINAAGPWLDQFGGQRLIGGTKGSHIVIAPFAGAPANAVYLEAASDLRPFFIIPWNGNYLIGTTDVRFQGNPDEAFAEEWEIDYLLAETNRAFSAAKLTRDEVLFTYSGVRPLPFTERKDEQSITRRHFIRERPGLNNLFSIVGGKLTTYRSLAEECVDLVFRRLGKESPECMTATVPLPGAKNLTSSERESQERLLRVYGSRAHEITALAARLNDDILAAEVKFTFENEFANSLSDCFLRRTVLGLNADLGLGQIEAAAEIGKRFLGWSNERAEAEVDNYRSDLRARGWCRS
jgi:glycerol-3-phosphate dehydrogenase